MKNFVKTALNAILPFRESLAPKLALCDRPVRDDSILCCHLRRQNTETKKMPSVRPFDSLICVFYRKTPVNRGIFIGVPGGSRTHGLSLRRRTLYPTELRKLIFSVAIIYLFLFFGKSFFFYRLSFLFALDFVSL